MFSLECSMASKSTRRGVDEDDAMVRRW
jgi:hypothetical protein